MNKFELVKKFLNKENTNEETLNYYNELKNMLGSECQSKLETILNNLCIVSNNKIYYMTYTPLCNKEGILDSVIPMIGVTPYNSERIDESLIYPDDDIDMDSVINLKTIELAFAYSERTTPWLLKALYLREMKRNKCTLDDVEDVMETCSFNDCYALNEVMDYYKEISENSELTEIASELRNI